MTQMTAADSFVQAVQALPQRLRQEALSLPAGDRARAEELRLRAGEDFRRRLQRDETE